MNLFEDDHDSEESLDKLTINKSYAQVYDDIRAGEELNKLKTKYGDLPIHQLKRKGEGEEESSSESESEDEEELELDLNFLKTLSALKSKDPKIYDAQTQFFGKEVEGEEVEGEEDDDSDDVEGEEKSKRRNDKKGDKPMFLKDYERETILAGGKFDEDEEEDDVEMEEENGGRPMSPSYAEEQRKIKESFKMALDDDDDDEVDDHESGTKSFLTKKVKTKEEKEKEENEFKAWLLTNDLWEEEEKAGSEEIEKKDLSGLKAYWNQPNLEEGEKFLKDFLLSKRYVVDEDDDDHEVGEDDDSSSGEEEEMDRMDEFETKFNFRFQEPDADVIKSYPRTIQETVRKEARSRKEKRDAREERKKEEKQKVIEELNLMKDLKQKEILSRVEQLKKISGKETVGGTDPLDDEYFDKDFDPEEHDAMVAKMFDDDYYAGAGAAEDEKLPGPPPLPMDGIAAAVLEELTADQDNWDEWDGVKVQEGEEEGDEDPDAGDDSLAAGAISDFLQSERASRPTSRKEKRQRQKDKKKSLFKKAIEKEKPVFDPNLKTFDEYIEEYYKLNFEDVIGKTPVRFKYRNVQANAFGLSMEEILAARDKELNQWASIKKASQYRTEEEEMYDLKAFEAKGKNAFKKKQVLKSLFEEQKEEEEEKTQAEVDSTVTDNTEEIVSTTSTATPLPTTAEINDSLSGAKKKKKKKGKKKKQNVVDEVTEQSRGNGGRTASDETKVSPEGKTAHSSSSHPPSLTSSSLPFTSTSLPSTATSLPSTTSKAQTNSDSKKKKRKKKRKNDSTIASEESPAKKKIKAGDGEKRVEVEEEPTELEGEKETKKQEQNSSAVEISETSSTITPSIARKKKKKKTKKGKTNGDSNASAGDSVGAPGGSKNFISESRLRAYDINPKKFQRFQKYGKTAKSRAEGTFSAE